MLHLQDDRMIHANTRGANTAFMHQGRSHHNFWPRLCSVTFACAAVAGRGGSSDNLLQCCLGYLAGLSVRGILLGADELDGKQEHLVVAVRITCGANLEQGTLT